MEKSVSSALIFLLAKHELGTLIREKDNIWLSFISRVLLGFTYQENKGENYF